MRDWERVTGEPDRLGESPFWHPHERCLYWVDIPARLLKRRSAGGATESWEMPSEPGCIAPVEGGGLIVALRDGMWRTREWGTALTCVVPFEHDTSKFRFNDGKADPLGRFWAGTIYEPRDERKAELFCIDLRPDNGNGGAPLVTLKAGNATTANGLAWSPDAKTLYWTDTPQHVIRQWDWDANTNAMRNERLLRQFPPKPAGWQPGQPGYGGRPDGASVDAQGNYWCAMYEGRRLLKLSPGGEILEDIDVPMRSPTMPCFGGDDLRTLFVTGVDHGVIATRVDVPGLPVNFVRA
ncbi:SMP-30/gluconolactonase/LRE family protein [Ramlibacter sp. PS4R-6]|uniref:SMP-30/gluconolactonase/LRE family protein n=1 Tax=Ramlibacter sp. PS4R-6 TaxID=3133438 RepID=UPI0030AC9F25